MAPKRIAKSGAVSLTPGTGTVILTGGTANVTEHITRENMEREWRALEQSRRAKGGARSGQSKKAKNLERDQRIHDAKASGQTPKQIASSVEIFPGRISQKAIAKRLKIVYRVLSNPRPQ